MKTYSVLFAEDVPHYGTAQIEAENDGAALEAAKAYDLSEITNDPEWENSVCRRIVHIEDAEGNMVFHDVPLDGFFLRDGGENERQICDTARELLDALTDLLGDRPEVQGGVCQHCGRDYLREGQIEGDCGSDDCPSTKARAAIAKAKGGPI